MLQFVSDVWSHYHFCKDMVPSNVMFTFCVRWQFSISHDQLFAEKMGSKSAIALKITLLWQDFFFFFSPACTLLRPWCWKDSFVFYSSDFWFSIFLSWLLHQIIFLTKIIWELGYQAHLRGNFGLMRLLADFTQSHLAIRNRLQKCQSYYYYYMTGWNLSWKSINP